jgi:D-glycero-D-manno-heptose 1,7-bisphosphate phosphatase
LSSSVGGSWHPSVRSVLLDRDGVINRLRSDHVKRWAEFEPLPGAVEAAARISMSGRDVIVVTNQSAIARQLVAPAVVAEIHDRLSELVQSHGGRITAFLVCPHAPEDGCWCRKPAPGLLLRARDELGIDMATTVMVGDQLTDVRAAMAAGCRSMLVDPERTMCPAPINPECLVVSSLAEAADAICGT